MKAQQAAQLIQNGLASNYNSTITKLMLTKHGYDEAKAEAMIYRAGALALALAAITLWIISHYRSQVAPGRDKFSFIPMKYCAYAIAAGALAAFVTSFFATGIF